GLLAKGEDQALHGVQVRIEAGEAALAIAVETLGAEDDGADGEELDALGFEAAQVALDAAEHRIGGGEGFALGVPALALDVRGAAGDEGFARVEADGAEEGIGRIEAHAGPGAEDASPG